MARKFQSPADMLAWQYRSILEELNELQRHASDPSCPCMQSDQGEYCLHKHSLGLHTLAKETASMDPANLEMLETLAVEALDQHNALKDRITCGKEHKDEKDTVKWARSWRKRIEPVYYSCGHKAKLQSDSAPAKPEVKISGKCTGTSCDLKVKATESVPSLAERCNSSLSCSPGGTTGCTGIGIQGNSKHGCETCCARAEA